MKLKMFFALLAMGAIGLQSCDNDDDDVAASKVPAEIRNAFDQSYPDTRNLKWELETVSQQQYYKAEFNNKRESDYQTSAWYTASGTWCLTETEMPYSAIPAAIKTAFEAGEYAKWKRDNEVDKVERAGMETVYIIDVESATDEDVDLYYSVSGILIKAVSEQAGTVPGDGSLLPDAPSSVVSAAIAFVKEKYPNAKIVEVDVERGITEIDIIDGNIGKEVLLDASNKWISTSWEVFISTLPKVVTDAVAASYNGYLIDDAEYFETPAGNYYLLELEKAGASDVKIKVDANGQIIK